MQIDKPEHRTFLLEMLAAVNIPGAHVDLYVEVREALKSATVTEPAPCERT